MKRTMSFRLSDETNEILERKASALDLSKTKVLECMIHEFSPSTLEEKIQQKKDRNNVLRVFLANQQPDTTIKKAWNNGFSNGWDLFQLRKSTSLFRTSRSEITKHWLEQKILK